MVSLLEGAADLMNHWAREAREVVNRLWSDFESKWGSKSYHNGSLIGPILDPSKVLHYSFCHDLDHCPSPIA